MEGQYFYLIGWMAWVVVTFFFSNKKERFIFSSVILLLIITSSIYIPSLGFTWNGAFIILLLTVTYSIAQTVKNKLLLYYLSISTISLAYVCFSIFEVFDPVWVIFSRHWMLGFILLYLCLMLFKKKKERFLCLLAGMIQGEVVTIFLFKNVFSYSIVGDFLFLDIVAVSVAGLSIWLFFEQLTLYLDTFIQKHVKEKQG